VLEAVAPFRGRILAVAEGILIFWSSRPTG